jgi:hypothetical protein
MVNSKLMMTNKCTSVVARFKGLVDAPEQNRRHRLMRHVQGYSGSHWTPAQATTCSVLPQRLPGQQANKQQSTNIPKKVAVLMAMATHRYVTMHIVQWRRFKALLDATKRHHQASIAAICCNRSRMCRFYYCFFIINSYKKVTGRC